MPVIDPGKIDTTTEAYQLAQHFYEDVVNYDYIPNGVLAHMVVPEIGKAVLNLMLTVLQQNSNVSAELKLLIANMTSYAVGCTYCQTNTFEAAMNVGAKNEKLDNMWDYRKSDLFSDAERAALDIALAASSIPSEVTEQHRSTLKEYFSQEECAEIMATISVFSYFQKWNDTNGTLLEQHVINVADKYLADSDHLDRVKYRGLKP